MNRALWIIQILLALLFLFAGGSKFVMPVAEMTKDSPPWITGGFLHFIGACELLGAVGLILPMLLRIKPGLTPLAAAGLSIITIGATAVTLMGPSAATAVIPLVTALLAAFVAYGRWRAAPQS